MTVDLQKVLAVGLSKGLNLAGIVLDFSDRLATLVNSNHYFF